MKRVAGLDVHKNSIFAGVKKGKYQSEVKEFDTTTEGLSELHHWLHGETVSEVAMESTGIYWMPVWHALEQNFKLYLVNPYFIKQMPGPKTDVQDAQWIATLLDKGMPRSSVVPEKTIRILRMYLRRFAQLQGQRTRCSQAIEKQLSQCNIKIASLSLTIGSQEKSTDSHRKKTAGYCLECTVKTRNVSRTYYSIDRKATCTKKEILSTEVRSLRKGRVNLWWQCLP